MRDSENNPIYVWELRQETTLLGLLTLKDQDMFWFFCDFAPTPEFEPYRALFAQEAALSDADLVRADHLYAQIGKLGLSLLINNTFDEENAILLHI